MKSKRSRSGATSDPGLSHVQSEHLPESGVQQVSRGVVAGGVLAADGVDVCVDGLAEADRAGSDLAEVDDQAGHHLLRVGDGNAPVVA